MTALGRRLGGAVFALVAPGFLLAQAEYRIGPPPAWVEAGVPLVGAPLPPESASDGTELQLLDIQERVRDHALEQFVHAVYRVRDENAVQRNSQLEFVFDPSYQQLTLHTAAVIRNGQQIDQLESARIQVLQRETRLEFQTYDGSRSVVLVLEDVRPGDVIEYSYTRTGANPVFRGHYMRTVTTETESPIGHLRFRLLWPRHRLLFIRADDGTPAPRIQDVGAQREYVWDVHDVPPRTVEIAVPLWYRPFASVQLSDFATWADVVAWGAALFTVPPGSPAAIVKPLTEIRAASQDPLDRMRRALRFVQEEVRYLAVEIGANSHRPYPPSTVMQRRYGDCKDKALLLITMLRELGIDAWPALVSSAAGGRVADYHPTAAVFDHVIVRAILDGQELWLNPTGRHQRDDPAASPGWSGAALVLAPGVTGVSRIPDAPRSEPLDDIVVELRLGDAEQPGDMLVSTTHRGSSARYFRAWKSETSPEDMRRTYLDFYGRLYPSIEAREEIVIEDDETADLVTITEQYAIPEFWEPAETGAYVGTLYPLELAQELPSSLAANRTMPLGVSHPVHVRYRIEARSDEGWSIAPEHDVVETPAMRFERRVSVEGTLLALDYEYETLSDHVAPDAVGEHIAGMGRARALLEYPIVAPNLAAASASWLDPREINWLILLVAAGALAFAVWGAVRVYPLQPVRFPQAPPPAAPSAGDISGIGGWLVLVALGMIASPLVIGSAIVTSSSLYTASAWAQYTTPGTAWYHWAWAPVLIFELVVNVALIVFTVLLAFTFFRRKRVFPALFIAVVAARLLTNGVDSLLIEAIATVPDDGELYLAGSPTRQWLMGMIWIAYMARSRRVRNTFVE